FTEAVGEGYFSQVLISKLLIEQRAGYLNQFDYTCEVIEYVEPPEPAAAGPFGALDAELITEATSLVDNLQDTLDAASQLTDLIANVPSFSDPTPALKGILGEYADAASEGAGSLADLKNIL
ncbi:MAG: hypothetical protein ACE5I1_13320, partial [bacterium]